MIAMGKPKSGTSSGSGMSTTSESSPDQSSDGQSMMADDDEKEEGDEDSPADSMEEDEDLLCLPQGFNIPSDGKVHTTVMGTVVEQDGKNYLKVQTVGDMPIHGGESSVEGGQDEDENAEQSTVPSDEQPDQSSSPDLANVRAAYTKRKKDEMAATKAFRS